MLTLAFSESVNAEYLNSARWTSAGFTFPSLESDTILLIAFFSSSTP